MFVIPSNTDRPSVNRHALITDGPILTAHADRKQFRAERIRVDYQWNGQGWSDSRYTTEVSGTNIKKDGTPGQMDVTVRFYGDVPVWVTEIVNQLRPHGTPVTRTSQFEVEVDS